MLGKDMWYIANTILYADFNNNFQLLLREHLSDTMFYII